MDGEFGTRMARIEAKVDDLVVVTKDLTVVTKDLIAVQRDVHHFDVRLTSLEGRVDRGDQKVSDTIDALRKKLGDVSADESKNKGGSDVVQQLVLAGLVAAGTLVGAMVFGGGAG